MLGAGLWFRLQLAPLRLEWVESRLGSAVSASLPAGSELHPGRVELSWENIGAGPSLFLRDFSCATPDGAVRTRLREARLNLQVMRLFLGQVVIEDLDVSGLWIRLRRDEHGRLALPSEDKPTTAAARKVTVDGGTGLGNPLLLLCPRGDPSLAGRLRRLSLSQATLEIDDRGLGETWSVELPTLGLQRTRDSAVGLGSARVRVGQDAIPLGLRLGPLSDASPIVGGTALRLTFRDLRPELAARLVPALKSLRRLDAGIFGVLGLELSPGGVVKRIPLQLRASEGSLDVASNGPPWLVGFSEFVAEAAFTTNGQLVSLQSASLRSAGARIAVRDVVVDLNANRFAGSVLLEHLTLSALDKLCPPGWLTANRSALRERGVESILGRGQGQIEGALRRGENDVSMDAWTLGIDAAADAASAGHNLRATLAYAAADNSMRLDADFKDLPATSLTIWLEPLLGRTVATMPLSGTVHALLARGELTSLQATLQAGAGTVLADHLLTAPLRLDSLRLEAGYTGSPARLELKDLQLASRGATIGASLTLEPHQDKATEGRGAVRAHNVPLPLVLTLWPEDIAPKTRHSIVQIVREALVDEAAATFEIGQSHRPGVVTDLTKLDGTGRFSGATVDPRIPIPFFEGVSGSASFTHERVDFTVDSGRWQQTVTGPTAVRLMGLQTHAPWLEVDVRLDGALSSYAPLLKFTPATLFEELHAPTSASPGTGALDLKLKLPLLLEVRLEDATIDGRLALKGADLVSERQGARLADLDGTLALVLEGGQTRFEFESTVGNLALHDWVRGPATLNLRYAPESNARSRLVVESDLGAADVRLPGIGYHKEPATAAKLVAPLLFTSGGLAELDGGSFETPRFVLAGSARWDPKAWNPVPVSIEVRQFAWGENRWAAAIERGSEDAWKLRSQGGVWDVRPFFRASSKGESSKPGGDTRPFSLDLDVDAESVVSPDGVRLEDVRLRAHRTSRGDWREAEVDATLANGTPLKARLAPPAGEAPQPWSVESGNAGDAFVLLGSDRLISDGKLTASGTFKPSTATDPAVWNGKVLVKDFRLTSMPAAAKVLSAAALTGIVNLLRGRGLAFSQIDGEFTFSDGQLRLQDVAGHGTELGVVVPSAQLDLNRRTCDLEGSLWPGYALNYGFRALPLLRDLLTGPEGQGIIGISFKATGPLSSPNVQASAMPKIGVLSALRRLLPGSAAPAPSPAPQPSQPPSAPALPTAPAASATKNEEGAGR